MNTLNVSALFVMLATLAACGGSLDSDDFVDRAGWQMSEGETEGTELSAVGFNNDACQIKLTQATYTLAQGGSIDIDYRFFKLSSGDRVRITRIVDGKKVWGSKELAEASGTLSVPVSQLGKGDFRIQGFVNTYKTNQEADCGPNVKVVIRVM
jgi:hypothetical protein